MSALSRRGAQLTAGPRAQTGLLRRFCEMASLTAAPQTRAHRRLTAVVQHSGEGEASRQGLVDRSVQELLFQRLERPASRLGHLVPQETEHDHADYREQEEGP